MGNVCPNKSSSEWRNLVTLTGSEETADRIFQLNANKLDSLQEAVNLFDTEKISIQEKINRVNAYTEHVTFDDSIKDENTGEREHAYLDEDNQLIPSMSETLDNFPELKFDNAPEGTEYSNIGTGFHNVMESYVQNMLLPDADVVTGEKNVRKMMTEKGIPSEFFNQVASFMSRFKTGIVLTEKILADLNINVAGTVDLIHFREDGKIDIYDFKSAHQTPYIENFMKENGGGIWNPVSHYKGYKAKRYPAQLEGYGRMVEKVVGQPVNNKFVVPIEVEYNNIGVPADGVKSSKILPIENITSYGNNFTEAVRTVNEIFKQQPKKVGYTIDGVNEIFDYLGSITGQTIHSKSISANQYAENFLKTGTLSADGRRYNFQSKGWKSFPLNATHAQKVAEIAKLYSGLDVKRKNIANSLINYMETGDNNFISSKVKGASVAAKVIKPYFDLYGGSPEKFETSGLQIYALNSVEGFNGTDGWIVFERDGIMDLFYFGTDNLNARLTAPNGRGRNTLFSKYYTRFQAKQELGSDLNNDWGDLKKVEATLIAMKMRKNLAKIVTDEEGNVTNENANIKFGTILIASSEFDNRPRAVDLNKMLPIVNKMGKDAKLNSTIPANLQHIFNDEGSFNVDNYSQNFLKSYMDLLNHTNAMQDLNPTFKTALYDFERATEERSNTILRKNQFAHILLDRLNFLVPNINTDGDEAQAIIKERELISQMIFQLKGVNLSMDGIDKLYKELQMPQNIGNAILQDVVLSSQNAINDMQNLFIINYKNNSNKVLRKFFNTKRDVFGHAISDKLLGQSTRHYDSVYHRQDYNVLTEQSTTKENLIDFTLVVKGTAEWDNLSQGDKDYIDYFNETIEKYAKLAGMVDNEGNSAWAEGQVPLIPASFSNNMHRKLRGDNISGKQSYNKILMSRFLTLEDNFGFGEGDLNLESSKKVKDSFYNQYQVGGRAEMLGLDENSDTIDPSKTSTFETNLEVVLDVFVMNAIRVSQLNRLAGVFNAAETVFNMFNSKLFNNDVLPNLDWLETYRLSILHNRDVDSGTVAAKVVRTGNALASIAIIGFKPMSPLVAFLGQQFTASSQTLANLIVDNGKVNAKELATANLWMANPKNWKKAAAIIDNHGIVGASTTEMLNGFRRYGEGYSSFVKGGYLLFHAGDWWSRGQYLIAQLQKDGALEQYDYDGTIDVLTYDEAKGNRFKGKDGKLLLEYFQREGEINGSLTDEGKLTRAYDNNHISRLKAEMNAIIGGMDRESRATINNSAKGKLFGVFKSWVPSRLNKFYLESKERVMYGKPVKRVDPVTGKDIMIWEDGMMEGMFQSLLALGHDINKNKDIDFSRLEPIQQENLARIASDALHFGVIIMLASIAGLAIGDEKEGKEENLFQTILRRGLQDLVATYNPTVIGGYLATPVLITQIAQVYKSMTDVVTGDEEMGDRLRKASKLTGVPQRLDEIYKLIGINNEE